ncbi:MAG: hypothetical protein HYZ51_00725 [Candidatus Doudnabacteria bacterium]|nr:hypothetical protein [Candidatus Doudnabacteria bacterium]
MSICAYSEPQYVFVRERKKAKYSTARITVTLKNDGSLEVQSVQIVSDQHGAETIRQAAKKAGIRLEEDITTTIIQQIADLPC